MELNPETINNHYSAIAGVGLHAYLFTLCSLDKLDVSYDSHFSLNYEFLKQEYPIDADQKNKLKQRQANLLLLQIISGLEVGLIQASILARLIEKHNDKPLSNDEIDNHDKEYLKKSWGELWKTLENSFLLKDLSEDEDFKKYFTEIKNHAEKLYKCRHALMHRGGRVAEQDMYPKNAESLEISYRKLFLSLQGTETGKSYNPQKMIANKTSPPEPFIPTTRQETIRAAKQFKVDDQINFEDQDLICIYSTFYEFTVILQSCITTIITTLNFVQIIINSSKTKQKHTLK